MTPFEREELKRSAQAKLAAMRERASRLRRRVLTVAAIGFVVLWIAIFAQMLTGHDPALGPVTATLPSAAQESVAADPERRALKVSAPREEGDERWSEAARFEEEKVEEVEVEALEAEAEAQAAKAEELEAATTGQS